MKYVPGRAGPRLSIKDREAEIDLDGLRRTVSLWLTPEAQVGDYVYIHAGYVISVLDAEEAEETLRLLNELSASYEMDELFRSARDSAPLPDTASSTQPVVVNPLAGLELV